MSQHEARGDPRGCQGHLSHGLRECTQSTTRKSTHTCRTLTSPFSTSCIHTHNHTSDRTVMILSVRFSASRINRKKGKRNVDKARKKSCQSLFPLFLSWSNAHQTKKALTQRLNHHCFTWKGKEMAVLTTWTFFV